MNNDTTEWKDIPGYEGRYRVSNQGQIFNVRSGKIIQGWLSKGGYHCVTISSNNHVVKRCKLHRLVMLAFAGRSNLTVNHKNGVKTDNRLENLEYATVAENNQHAQQSGLSKPPPRKPIKLDENKVRNIRSLYTNGATKKALAHMYGVSRVTIRYVIQRKTWNHID